MLTICRGTVVRNTVLNSSGFTRLELHTSDGVRTVIGNRLEAMKVMDEVIVLGKDETKPKWGRQISVLKWWFAHAFDSDTEQAQRTLAFLEENFSPRMALKIFELYGERAEEIIRCDPWGALIGIVPGARLDHADELAQKFNLEQGEMRVAGVVVDFLRKNRSLQGIGTFDDGEETYGRDGGGHVCLDLAQVVCHVAEALSLPRKGVKQKILEMASSAYRKGYVEHPILVIESEKQRSHLYEYALHRHENSLALSISSLLDAHVETYGPLALPDHIRATEEQIKAATMALSHPLSILTGGPGTGKTTIIAAVTQTLTNLGFQGGSDFLLCAPTGVAAQRLSNATSQPASTIHRLLAYNPRNGKFTFHRGNPLQTKFLICDESSMIDLKVMALLFEAIPPGAHVLLVGDADQLPPISPGAPFRDLLSWGKVPTTRLTKIYRQELADSLIIQASRAVMEEQTPKFRRKADEPGDLFGYSYDVNKASVQEKIANCLLDFMPKVYGLKPEEIQVICPYRTEKGGPTSTTHLNAYLQKRIQGTPPEGSKFCEGDRVIHVKNNYEISVMNGEIGYVTKVYPRVAGKEKYAQYDVKFLDGRTVEYRDKERSELELAYCLTVHKMQGLESPGVIIVAKAAGKFFNRNMLYTALTRGKKAVVVIGPGTDFMQIVRTPAPERFSRLAWRLENRAFKNLEDENVYELEDERA